MTKSPHTSARDGGGPAGTRWSRQQLHSVPKTQPPPHPSPTPVACVPSPLTRRAPINSPPPCLRHTRAQPLQAQVSPIQKKHKNKQHNAMSPSIITEANQPLPAKSTVAQRKQANELRKVRRNINTCLCIFLNVSFSDVIFFKKCRSVTKCFPSFIRLSNRCWRREDVLVSTTVSLT